VTAGAVFLAVAFYLFASVTVGAAVVVVFARNLIHSAYALFFTLFGVAGLYVLLGADFLAGAQILIYVGGIMVLLLFGVMLTNRIYGVTLHTGTYQLIPGVIVFLALATAVIGVALTARWGDVVPVNAAAYAETTESIGKLLLTRYLLPFEVASVLLLAALIAAAMLVRPARGEEAS
jgi:NADH-quinone oxidoreductase subunit J